MTISAHFWGGKRFPRELPIGNTMHNTRIVSLLLAVASLWTTPAWSKTYPLPPADSRLIGELEDYIVQPGDHLELVGKHTQIGFLALVSSHDGREKIGAAFWWQARQSIRLAGTTRGVAPAR